MYTVESLSREGTKVVKKFHAFKVRNIHYGPYPELAESSLHFQKLIL
jgi:hypothetical protein